MAALDVCVDLYVPDLTKIRGLEEVVWFSETVAWSWRETITFRSCGKTPESVLDWTGRREFSGWNGYTVSSGCIEELDRSMYLPWHPLYGQMTPVEDFILNGLGQLDGWVWVFWMYCDHIDHVYEVHSEHELVEKLKASVTERKGFIAYKPVK